ncbi:polysaccharide deacetylase [Desulfofundulus kuznetsovii DSM 6115]|uniref:Polysaccharide deacetylase n=2 Tax=Desulfofundulus kuznetsovii TaxID=58135 RepID=A0AAU8PBY7_DESK7|nr:polysaccharide deacetylase [Desulfofundulus kuznetsovii DSM 6115]
MNLLGMARLLLLFFLPWSISFSPPAHSASSANFHAGYGNRVAVLMYHHISDTSRGPAVITPRLFQAHLDTLKKEGYNVISAEKLARFLSGKDTIPPKAVVITFDDGYESFYTYAYPELKKRNMPATCFVIVKSVGDPKERIPKLTWEQMREMQASGMSFYPHSYDSHYQARFAPGVPAARYIRPALAGPIWLGKLNRRETQEEYEARVRADLLKAKEVMEMELGRPMDHFCWPYGADSPTAARIARSLGYKYLYYIRKGLNDPHITDGFIRRINAGSPDVTPEILIRKIEKYSLLTSARQWCLALSPLYPALLKPTFVALESI